MNSINLSLGNKKTVCGYEIKKMPLGAYLHALERLQNLPADLMNVSFPGKSFSQILDTLSEIDSDGLTELAVGAFAAAPKYAAGIVAELTGIDEEKLLNDENIGLDGFIDIVDALIEVNRLGECIKKAGALKPKIEKMARTRTIFGFRV